MSTLKESWEKVGDELETLGKDLGKTIVKTVKAGAKVVSDWAEKDDEKAEPPKEDVVIEPEEKKE
jgi:hypothetical protein